MNDPFELQAVVVEHSDDGGQNWDVGGIAWTVVGAALLGREYPWAWRLRKVNLSLGELVSDEETKSALDTMEKMEQMLAALPDSCFDEFRDDEPVRKLNGSNYPPECS